MREPDLSIVILNYNVCELLINCLESIFKNKGKEDNWQVIVVDNASKDGSVEAVKGKYTICHPEFISGSNVKMLKQVQHDRLGENAIELIESKENLGFSRGNNLAIPFIKAPVVLFLNPDTVIVGDVIQKCLKKLQENPDLGAITCKVELPDGRLDYSCHRGFPTPWNSFAYFSGLAKIFPHSPIFAGYTADFLDTKKPHEIDCCTGAFLMVRKIAAEQINWWDTDYFWNGEDIEFCYSLKEKGWKIYYYPEAKIIHYKGSSSGLWKTGESDVQKHVRVKAISHAANAMRIFYMKHFYYKYPPLLRDMVLWGIGFLENYRRIKIHLSSRT